jgi:2-succinyl-5-enolpyruvyl-6-hydroxy-3-cyclohexene-1-carboxylate synthase
MTAPNANTLWARVLADELARAGVEHVTLAPGSRSTPLVLAFARRDDVDLHVHVDERSAAFHALGLGKATRRPAAAVTTSGTAVANLHPAAVEARFGEAPLVLLTADRPPELRGTDANQTVDQDKLFGDDVLAYHDLGRPELTRQGLAHLRATADRVVAEAVGPPAGPVHANAPFAKPLEPKPADDVPDDLAERTGRALEGRPEGEPWTRIRPEPPRAREHRLAAVAEDLADAERPLVVAGPAPEPDRLGPAAIELARALEAPLVADPLSGARFAPGAPEVALGHADLLLEPDRLRAALAPDRVLRLGATPTSKRATWWREAVEAPTTVVDVGGPWKDAPDAATRYVRADPAHAAQALADRVEPAGAKRWTGAWRAAEARARRVLGDALVEPASEPGIAAAVARGVPDGGQLVVGNSSPVRDVDAYAAPREDRVRVLGNRGASGIDGLTSTALGAAQGAQTPTAALVGDLSLLHDANGLHALADAGAPLVLVVVHNDGGGIFHRLPIREHEGFEDLFATPHGRELAPLAELHGLDHEQVEPSEVEDRVRAALDEDAPRLVEVRTDRERAHARREELVERVRSAVDDVELPR